jgi:hypothetical protein
MKLNYLLVIFLSLIIFSTVGCENGSETDEINFSPNHSKNYTIFNLTNSDIQVIYFAAGRGYHDFIDTNFSEYYYDVTEYNGNDISLAQYEVTIEVQESVILKLNTRVQHKPGISIKYNSDLYHFNISSLLKEDEINYIEVTDNVFIK